MWGSVHHEWEGNKRILKECYDLEQMIMQVVSGAYILIVHNIHSNLLENIRLYIGPY